MFPVISSFTKIQTPLDPTSFPRHHNLYLRPEVSTKQTPWPFHLTSCMQNTSTFFFLSSSHTSVFLPQRFPTFKVNKDFTQILYHDIEEILRTPWPLKSFRGRGAFLFFLVMGICWSKIFVRRACPCLPQLQFSDLSSPTKQLSWLGYYPRQMTHSYNHFLLFQLNFEKTSRNLEDQLSEAKSKVDQLQRDLNEINTKFARTSSEKVR